MKISKLVQSKKAGLVQIFADDEYIASISMNSLIKFSLYQGKEVSESEWAEILRDDIFQKMLFLAIKQISSRPRSVFEIKQYLKKKIAIRIQDELSAKTIAEQVIDKLLDQKYLDDAGFCEWWINNRQEFKGKSRAELQSELRQKGVSSVIVETALNSLLNADDQGDVIRRTAYKKFKIDKLPSDKKSALKVYNYFLRRGFSYDFVKSALSDYND